MSDVDSRNLSIRELVLGTTGGIHLLAQLTLAIIAFIVAVSVDDPTASLKFLSFVLFMVFFGSVVTLLVVIIKIYQLLPDMLRDIFVIMFLYGLAAFFCVAVGISVSTHALEGQGDMKAAGIFGFMTGIPLLYKLYRYFTIYKVQGRCIMENYPLD